MILKVICAIVLLSNVIAAEFCSNSPTLFCKMKCPELPECEATQCLYRSDGCCTIECIDKSDVEGINTPDEPQNMEANWGPYGNCQCTTGGKVGGKGLRKLKQSTMGFQTRECIAYEEEEEINETDEEETTTMPMIMDGMPIIMDGFRTAPPMPMEGGRNLQESEEQPDDEGHEWTPTCNGVSKRACKCLTKEEQEQYDEETITECVEICEEDQEESDCSKTSDFVKECLIDMNEEMQSEGNDHDNIDPKVFCVKDCKEQNPNNQGKCILTNEDVKGCMEDFKHFIDEEVKDKLKIPKNCIQWYDGCNTCSAKNGKLSGCTRRMCFTIGKQVCKQYEGNVNGDKK